MATVKNYRMRQGVAPEDASNSLSGFTLGKMRLCGLAAARSGVPDVRGISAAQYEAGEAYARLVRRYEAIKGLPSGSPRSLDLGVGGTWATMALEPTEDHIARTKAQFLACYDALAEAARTIQHGRRPGANLMTLTYDVCVLNRPLENLSDEACGDVRLGLNALGRVLG